MKISLQKREVTGKKVKNMRAEGLIPAVVYGPTFESASVSVDRKQFRQLFSSVGYSKLFDVDLDGKTNKAILKEVQIDPVLRTVKHASFYAVAMDREIEAEVPLTVTGTAPAVKNSIGFMEMQLSTLPVRCLPADLPADITVDISELREVGDGITIADLNLGEKVTAVDLEDSFRIAFISAPQKMEEETEETNEDSDEETDGEAKAEGESDEKADSGE